MGRGRQKAKQTKVARELKYYSPQTDYERLQRELGGGTAPARSEENAKAPADDEPEDDDYGSWASGDRS